MALPNHTPWNYRVWHYTYLFFCGLVFFFLIAPLFVILPLSFNAEQYIHFSAKMLALDPEGFSLRWYEDMIYGTKNPWGLATKNSLIIAFFATIGSTLLGTVAALGLSSRHMPYKAAFMALLISPMICSINYFWNSNIFLYGKGGLSGNSHRNYYCTHYFGNTVCSITVTATLTGFDHSVTRAAASLGSNPVHTFRKITLPLIMPGVISGALFAFVTSFDEVIVVLFLAGLENTTIPIQMWVGLREQLSPTILAVATCLIVMSTLILVSAELLRRRSDRLRGINR
jgi:putative spermidine/putrescine transport system permease protein